MKNDIQSLLNTAAAPAHKPFSYLEDDLELSPLNEFVEMTLDISSGIATCLDLVFSHQLTLELNAGADPGDEVPPAIGRSEASNLLRLSIAVNKLLQDQSLRQVEWLNNHKRVKGGKS